MLMKYIGIILLHALIFLSGCRAHDHGSYWMAISSNKINWEPMRGITLSYMEMLIKAQPYDNLLLDSIYEMVESKDTLRINFYYHGTGEVDKRFVLHYVPVSKAKYEQAVGELKSRRHELLKSMVSWDASALDLNTTRPPYLADRTAMDLINPMQLALELTQTFDKTKVVYESTIVSKNDSLQRFRTLGIQYPSFSNKIAAQVGMTSFNHLELYMDAGSINQGMAMSQEKMSKVAMQELFVKITSQFPSAKMKAFGLPKRYNYREFSGIHSNIAVTWYDRNKVITLVVEGIPDTLFDREVDNNIALSDQETPVEISKVFSHYLALIDQAKVRLFVMHKDFDELMNRKENRDETKLPGQLWEYVTSWKYLYELND